MSDPKRGVPQAEAPEVYRQKRLKPVGVIGLFVCACLVSYLGQQPVPPQLEPFVESGFLKTAAMVGAGAAEHAATMDHQSTRPLFGMETEPVLGKLALKWRAVDAKIGHEEKVLADCRAQKPCPEPARELMNIIAETIGRTGRARIGLINRAVNLAITPTSDEAQWGVQDHWSSPLETLQSHRGDCEDYAIVKYLALREAGVSSEDVKILILRNLFPNEYHAVVAARANGEWLILDNRRLTLVRDTDMIRATPEFLLDESGAHRFVPSHGTLLSSLTNATVKRTGAHINFGAALG
jgi:predicted transglutaminase-like cysteine proteinase